jgi:ribonuclease HI/uncharacterized protein YeaO (DUF488 family)
LSKLKIDIARKPITFTECDERYEFLAPSWELLGDYKNKAINWDEYTVRYKAEMREAYKHHAKEFKRLANILGNLELVCWCSRRKSIKRCHRFLLRDILESVRREIYYFVRLRFDGGIQGGFKAYGFTITTPDKQEYELDYGSGVSGTGTSNQSEYDGLIAGLKACIKNGVKRVQIIGDSKLVVNQIKGNWRTRNDKLKPLCEQSQVLLRKFDWEISWQGRDNNSRADELVNQALGRI